MTGVLVAVVVYGAYLLVTSPARASVRASLGEAHQRIGEGMLNALLAVVVRVGDRAFAVVDGVA